MIHITSKLKNMFIFEDKDTDIYSFTPIVHAIFTGTLSSLV